MVFIMLVVLLFSSQIVFADAHEKTKITIGQSMQFGTGLLDPIQNSSVYAQLLVGAVYESLIGMDKDQNLVPHLATNWYPNDDYTVWTIELREGVQFHNGWGEMTAEDVKFSINRFRSPDCMSTLVFEFQAAIKDVNVVDRYTVEIQLTETNPFFVEYYLRDGPGNSEGLVMCKAYVDAKGEGALLDYPIGTGRWTLVEYDPDNRILFEAYDNHWSGEMPGYDMFELQIIPEESTRTAMIGIGSLDMVDLSIDSATSLDAMEEFEIVVIEETAKLDYRILSAWRPEAEGLPLSDLRVRKALSLAINREELVEALFGGLFDAYPLPGRFTGATGFALDTERWREWSNENLRFDPDRARELLEEAGFPENFITDEVTIWSYPSARGPWEPEVNEVLASYWADIGVKTNIAAADYYGYIRPMMRTVPHPQEFLGTIVTHSGATDIFPAVGNANFYSDQSFPQVLDWTCEETMDIIGKIIGETDPYLLEDYHNRLLEIIADSYLMPPIFYVSSTYVINTDKVVPGDTIRGIQYPTKWIHTFKPKQ